MVKDDPGLALVEPRALGDLAELNQVTAGAEVTQLGMHVSDGAVQ